jgi:hypothetical protein
MVRLVRGRGELVMIQTIFKLKSPFSERLEGEGGQSFRLGFSLKYFCVAWRWCWREMRVMLAPSMIIISDH